MGAIDNGNEIGTRLKSVMKRLPIVVLALLLLGVPALSRADDYNQTRNPEEYTEDDANPLRLLSYFFTPIGFALEWTITRPLHYLASQTFLAPALDSEYSSREEPLPVTELPTTELSARDVGPETGTQPQQTGIIPQGERAAQARPRTSAPATTGNQAWAPPRASSPSPSQPVLH